MAPTSPAELRRRLRRLEGEVAEARAELLAHGTPQALPGLYLVLSVAGQFAALPASAVDEVVPQVALTPLPGTPAHVLGSFVYRGTPHLAVDLATLIGRPRPVPLDAQMLVLASARPLAVVVDQVQRLLDSPEAQREGDDPSFAVWRAARLVEGICRAGDQLVPLLDVERLLGSVAPVALPEEAA